MKLTKLNQKTNQDDTQLGWHKQCSPCFVPAEGSWCSTGRSVEGRNDRLVWHPLVRAICAHMDLTGCHAWYASWWGAQQRHPSWSWIVGFRRACWISSPSNRAQEEKTDSNGFEIVKNLVCKPWSGIKTLRQMALVRICKLLGTHMEEGFETEGKRRKEDNFKQKMVLKMEEGFKKEQHARQQVQSETAQGLKNEENARQVFQKRSWLSWRMSSRIWKFAVAVLFALRPVLEWDWGPILLQGRRHFPLDGLTLSFKENTIQRLGHRSFKEQPSGKHWWRNYDILELRKWCHNRPKDGLIGTKPERNKEHGQGKLW